MKPDTTKRAIRWLSGLAAIVTVALSIVSARPWGDNYAYQDISGYLMLAGFMAWSISPYIYLLLSAGRSAAANRPSRFLSVAVAFLICVGGVAAVWDTVFIHIDAQGGLVFLFLPVYQWLLIGALEITLVILRRFTAA